jgi:hypothetical protein
VKKLVALVLLLASYETFAQKNPEAANYKIKMHVYHSRIVNVCIAGVCQNLLHLNAMVDGKNVELEDTIPRSTVLWPGDYQVRIVTSNVDAAYEFSAKYEVLFPDGKKRQLIVVGVQEQ